MARSLVLFLFLLFTIAAAASGASCDSHLFSRNLYRRSPGLKHEKLSHLRFYLHGTVSGPKPTAVRVAEVADVFRLGRHNGQSLDSGTRTSSNMIGRTQGIYASAAQEEVGFLTVLNFAFTAGKYNGSTMRVLAEMPLCRRCGRSRLSAAAVFSDFPVGMLRRELTPCCGVY